MPHLTFYLTVGGDGKAVITGLRPVLRRVTGTERLGVYCRPGDWLLIRNLCSEWVEKALGAAPPAGKTLKLGVDVEVIEEVAALAAGRHAA